MLGFVTIVLHIKLLYQHVNVIIAVDHNGKREDELKGK